MVFDELLEVCLEHGGAHKKVLQMMADKQKELEKKAKETDDPTEKKRLLQQAHNLSNKYLDYNGSLRTSDSERKTKPGLLNGNYRALNNQWYDGKVDVDIDKDLKNRKNLEKTAIRSRNNINEMNKRLPHYRTQKERMKADYTPSGKKKILQKYDTSVLKLNKKKEEKEEEFDDVVYDESTTDTMVDEYYSVVENLQRDLNNGTISYDTARLINDEAYKKYVTNGNPKDIMEYLLHDFEFKEKTNDQIMIESFIKYTDGFIDRNIFDLFIEYLKIDSVLSEEYITEAEDDHEVHMHKKQNAANTLDKDVSDLPNKKYMKDEETAKKADLKYKYEGSKQQNKHTVQSYNPTSNTMVMVTKDSPKESDMKLLNYMQAHSNLKDPEENKKYRKAFRMFCTKFGIEPNSSLYMKFDPDKETGQKMKMIVWPESKKMTREELDKRSTETGNKIKDNVEKKMLLPKGYCLIHKCRTDGLRSLSPRNYSDKYIQKGDTGRAGQYHATGRVYFVLQREDDITNTGDWGKGDHIYKLTSNVSGFFIDYEDNNQRSADRYADVKKLVGKAVYIKTDKPLKVEQVQ